MDVRYHQQDNEYFCGPATVLMLIDSIGTGDHLPNEACLADDMGVDVKAAGDFYTTPKQMVDGLSRHVPLDGRMFIAHCDNDVVGATQRIVQSLRVSDGFPPIALYNYGNHWLIVTGVNTVSGRGGSQALCFFANSPIQMSSKAPKPFPHMRNDDCPSKGGRNVAVSYDHWQEMFGPAKGYGFVTITAEKGPGVSPESISGGMLLIQTRQPWFSAVGLHEREAALGAIRAYKLAEEGPLAAVMSKVDGIGDVNRVLDLELSDEERGHFVWYDCIPLMHGSDVAGVLSLDPTGTFMTTACAFDRHSLDGGGNIVGAEQAWKIALDFAAPRTLTAASTDAIPAGTHMVWRPSTESIFPSVPFYRFPVNDGNVFVRHDGAPFNGLTPLRRR